MPSLLAPFAYQPHSTPPRYSSPVPLSPTRVAVNSQLPLDPEEVRKKLRALERAFAQDASLFEEEEMMQRREQEIGPRSPLGPFVVTRR